MTADRQWVAGCLAFSVIVHAAVLFHRLPMLERPGDVISPVIRLRVSLSAGSGSSAVSGTPDIAPGSLASSGTGIQPRTAVQAAEVPKRIEPGPAQTEPVKRTNVRPTRGRRRAVEPVREPAKGSTVPAADAARFSSGASQGAASAAAESETTLLGHSGAEGGGGTGPAVARVKYEQVLAAWIERHTYYPLSARRRGLQGTSSLKIALRRDGSLAESRLALTSDHEVLDDAALDIVRRSAPFPPVPDTVAGDSFEFTVPIRFKLE